MLVDIKLSDSFIKSLLENDRDLAEALPGSIISRLDTGLYISQSFWSTKAMEDQCYGFDYEWPDMPKTALYAKA